MQGGQPQLAAAWAREDRPADAAERKELPAGPVAGSAEAWEKTGNSYRRRPRPVGLGTGPARSRGFGPAGPQTVPQEFVALVQWAPRVPGDQPQSSIGYRLRGNRGWPARPAFRLSSGLCKLGDAQPRPRRGAFGHACDSGDCAPARSA